MKSFVLEETHMFLKIISEEIRDVESGLKAGILIEQRIVKRLRPGKYQKLTRPAELTKLGSYNQLCQKCCTKVIMSGVNGNVIMSGWRDDNPDDERREAARGYTKSI